MSLEKIKILILEDNDEDFWLISKYLKESRPISFDITGVVKLNDALALIKKQNFDAILSDLDVPDSRGLTTVDQITKSNSQLPIIVLTGIEDENLGLEALLKGAQDYLVKGRIESHLLVKSIRYAIERKQAEQAFHKSESRFKFALLAANAGAWEWDIASEGFVWSDEYYELFGVDPVKVKPSFELWINSIHPADRDDIKRKITLLLEKRKTEVNLEFRVIHNTRGIRWLNAKGTVSFDNQGRPVRMIGIIIDTTDRKHSEEELQRSNSILRAITETTPDLIFVKDNQSRLIMANPPALVFIGKTIEKIIGKNDIDLMGQGIGQPIIENDRKVIAHGVTEIFEEVYSGKTFLSAKTPLRNRAGSIIGLISISRDITQHKKAEEILKRDKETFEKLVEERTNEIMGMHLELARAKRLSDIGTLAATVAHELRNPLAAINIAASNIKRKTENNDLDLDKHIVSIEKKIAESDQIINNLLCYSRISSPKYENVDVYYLIEECLDQIKTQCRKKIIFSKRFDEMEKIQADPNQIKEVFMNIINNACDVVSDSEGKIEISGIDEGEFIKIVIHDNGNGVEKDILEKVFNPFFTTKTKGTGLGLSVCHQIVSLHEGSIDMESEKGKGTSVTVRLPKEQNRFRNMMI